MDVAVAGISRLDCASRGWILFLPFAPRAELFWLGNIVAQIEVKQTFVLATHLRPTEIFFGEVTKEGLGMCVCGRAEADAGPQVGSALQSKIGFWEIVCPTNQTPRA
jgi:hypothetical protein